MILFFDVDKFLLYKERKQVILQNYFWIDRQYQVSGIF